MVLKSVECVQTVFSSVVFLYTEQCNCRVQSVFLMSVVCLYSNCASLQCEACLYIVQRAARLMTRP